MTYDDIQQEFYLAAKTNSADFTAAQFTRKVKQAANRVISLILGSDGRWEYDDSNRVDLPIATTAIVSGQLDYSIDTTFIKIRRVELKDSNGIWRKLQPRDDEDYPNDSITQRQTVTGTPSRYDVMGNSIILDCAPNYSQAGSLKVYIERPQLDFDYTTGKFTDGSGSTASSPGFNSLYHALLWLWPAYEYCIINLPTLAPGYMAEIQRLETAMTADYNRRNRDDQPRITTKITAFR